MKMTRLDTAVIIIMGLLIIIVIVSKIKERLGGQNMENLTQKYNNPKNIVAYYLNPNEKLECYQEFLSQLKRTPLNQHYQVIRGLSIQQIQDEKKYRLRYSSEILTLKGAWITEALNHLELWKTCLLKGRPLLVFSGKLLFRSSYHKKIKVALNQLPKKYDLVYFYLNSDAKMEKSLKYFDKITGNNTNLNHYLVSPLGAKRLLDYFYVYHAHHPIGELISRLTSQQWLTCYLFNYSMVFPVSVGPN